MEYNYNTSNSTKKQSEGDRASLSGSRATVLFLFPSLFLLRGGTSDAHTDETSDHRRRFQIGEVEARACSQERDVERSERAYEDIEKCRTENFNLEKRLRKFNAWVANKPCEEYQADLVFFDDLMQREKVPTSTAK